MNKLSKLLPLAAVCTAACAHTDSQEAQAGQNHNKATLIQHLQKLNAQEEGVQPDGSVVVCDGNLPTKFGIGRGILQGRAMNELIAAVNGSSVTVNTSGNTTTATTKTSGSISGVTTEFSAPRPEGDPGLLCAKVKPPEKKDIDALIAYYRKIHANQQVINKVQQNFDKTQTYQQQQVRRMLNRKRIKNLIRKRQGK